MNDPDIKLVNRVKNDSCSESVNLLIEKHSPLCYNILNIVILMGYARKK